MIRALIIAILVAAEGTAFAQTRDPSQVPEPLDAPPPRTVSVKDPPLVGERNGLVYLRDPHDWIRLYPHAQLDLDAQGFIGSRVSDVPAERAGVSLGPRFFVRRARFELGGELFERIALDGSLDLANQPTIDGALTDGRPQKVALGDAWGEVIVDRGLRLRLGLFQSPVSIENRSRNADLAMMERNVAVRGFIAPGGQVLAASIVGRTRDSLFSWDLGASGAERIGPDQWVRGIDGIGRFSVHSNRDFTVGVSGRFGSRNPRDVGQDLAAMTSNQGFAMWRPTRTDESGHFAHVIPSGTEWALGVETRTLFHRQSFALRGEVFWVSRGTRETLDGGIPSDTLHDGRLFGVAADLELSWWPLQCLKLIPGTPPDLGTYPSAEHLEVADLGPMSERYGLEVAALGSAIVARYAHESDLGRVHGDIEIYQAGIGVNYWHTRRFKLSLGPTVYIVPGSGNLAQVPGNLHGDSSARVFGEVAARTTVMF